MIRPQASPATTTDHAPSPSTLWTTARWCSTLDRTYITVALRDKVISSHIEGPIYDAATASGAYINATAYNRQPANPGLWDGPFVLSDTQPNGPLIFKVNPHWTGRTPGLSEVIIRVFDSPAALQANLLSRDVDLTPSGIGLTIEQAIGMEQQRDPRFVIN